MRNENLIRAKKAKNDEFYTQLKDIENELTHYTAHFDGKVVYCNADNPEQSNFWKYFHVNFSELKLKKLISTHYVENGHTYRMDYMGGNDADISSGIKTPLDGNGDFRSSECEEILKESDIVVTNPPFSLFREYVKQLMDFKKKFLIIGNINSVKYKEIFPLIKNGKMWLGANKRGGSRRGNAMWFYSPSGSLKRIMTSWYTDLVHDAAPDRLILNRKYDPDEYPMFSNCDAINVGRTEKIPVDYDGAMGVPISFLEKFCPDQFEILSLVNTPKIGDRAKYARIIIRKYNIIK